MSQAISRHVINKSVSQVIGRRVMNKNHKFLREISKKKICDEIIINLLSTDIIPSR